MVLRTPIDRHAPAARSAAFALAAALALGGCAAGASRQGPEDGLPQSVQAQTSLQAMLRLAARTEGTGNLGAARKIYVNAVKKYPDAPAAHLGLARLTYRGGQPQAAAQHYRDALRHAPNSSEAAYGLGKALLAADRPEAAIEQFDRLIAGEEADHRPYLSKGVALDLLGRHAEAQRVYRAGLEVAPRNVSLRNNLGLSLALSQQHKEALRVLEDAARDPKATARTRQNLALVYGLAGDMDAAKLAGRRDLKPAAVERNLAYYEALRSARDAEADAEPGLADRAARSPATRSDPEPRRHQVAETPAVDAAPTPLTGRPAAPAESASRPQEPEPPEAKASASRTAQPDPAEPQQTPAKAAARQPQPSDPAAPAGTPAEAGPDGADATPTATPVAYQPDAASPGEIQAAGRAYWVQIAAFPSAATSRSEWQRLQDAHAELLSELSLSLQRTELADKGTFYRVRTGPFAGAGAAKRLCAALKARDQGCYVVRADTAS